MKKHPTTIFVTLRDCLFVLILSLPIAVKGQTRLYDEEVLKSIKPTAPTAASLGLYGEQEVNLSTGQVPISIDLYEIRSGDVKVPIRLIYHSGGIKMDQEASWVGLGWNLAFGASIVRTLNGYADEEESEDVPQDSTIRQSMESHPIDGIGFDRYVSLAKADKYQYSFRPDLFAYHAGAYNGTFYLRHDSIHTIPMTPLKGSLDEIITPDGTSYLFDRSEKTTISSQYVKLNPFISTYYVRSIVSPNHTDTIRYVYQDSGTYTYAKSSYYQGIYTEENLIVYQTGRSDASEGIQRYVTGNIPLSGTTPYITNVKTVKPRYIYFKKGRITFDLSPREDIERSQLKKLDRIIVESENNGQYNRIKEFRFFYSYFNGKNDNEEYLSKRLCLDSIVETGLYGRETVDKKTIARLEYYGKEGLPKKNSFDHDYWGFYNGRHNSDDIPTTMMDEKYIGHADKIPDEQYTKYGSLKSITYPTGGRAELKWEINRVNISNPLYMPDEIKSESASLVVPSTISCTNPYKPTPYDDEVPTIKGIFIHSYIDQTAQLSYDLKRDINTNNTHNKYDKCTIKVDNKVIDMINGTTAHISNTVNVSLKAGSSYSIFIKSNCYNASGLFTIYYNSGNPAKDKNNYPFAGLRIRELDLYDNNDSIMSRRCFEYKDSLGRSTGYLTSYDRIDNCKSVIDINEGIKGSGVVLTKRSNNLVFSELKRGPQSNEYAYSHVVEKVYDKNAKEPSTETLYDFSQSQDACPSYNIPPVSKQHLRGQLLRKREYEYIGGKCVLTRDIRNIYKTDLRGNDSRDGFIMFTMLSPASGGVLQHYLYYYGGNISSCYIPVNYSYTSDWVHLDSTIVVEPAYNGNMVSVTAYRYDSKIHQQPTCITNTCGGSPWQVARLVYPSDRNDSVYQMMTGRNMLLYPVEEKVFEGEQGKTETLTEGILRNYQTDTFGNIVLSDVYKYLPDGKPFRLFSYQYDKKGRVVEMTGEDHVPTAVCWDPTGSYPLAIATGMRYEEMQRLLAQGRTPYTLDRDVTAGLSLVTTYQHIPLIGVSSITLPYGEASQYDYDSLGRLIRTIVNEHATNLYEYHYATK